jgi:hypothetical protein
MGYFMVNQCESLFSSGKNGDVDICGLEWKFHMVYIIDIALWCHQIWKSRSSHGALGNSWNSMEGKFEAIG